MTEKITDTRLVDFIWQELCEIPDRSSPEDQPDMALVCRNDLLVIVEDWNEREAIRKGTSEEPKPDRFRQMIDELRREEGDQVTILCDNPDFNGQPNNAVVISAGWTGWQDFRVSGHTLDGALENAVAIKALAPDDRPVVDPKTDHAGDLLNQLSEHRNWEMGFHTKIYGDDDDMPTHDNWVVWKETGSINDREWIVMGFGSTPLAALTAAFSNGDGK